MQPDTTHVMFTTLGEYKFDPDNRKWMVYSDLTGWIVSQNEDSWFASEIIQNYFVTKEEYGKQMCRETPSQNG